MSLMELFFCHQEDRNMFLDEFYKVEIEPQVVFNMCNHDVSGHIVRISSSLLNIEKRSL